MQIPGKWLQQTYQYTSRFHITASYGLFSIMTDTRSEITVEGSNDGDNWQEYEFKWKIGGRKNIFVNTFRQSDLRNKTNVLFLSS